MFIKCIKIPTSNDSFRPQKHFHPSPQADLLFLPPTITEHKTDLVILES